MIGVGQAHEGHRLPVHVEDFDGIELARGNFDEITFIQGELLISGWLLLPDKELDSILVYWNGELVGSAEVELRQDVANVFPWIPHAQRSGFRFRSPKAIAETARVGRLDLLACQDGRPIARLSTLFRPDLDEVISTPPPELMDRVGACGNAPYFKLGGLKLFGDLMEPILRHRGHGSVRRLLDWGCGCGRVTVHFLLEPDVAEVFGCDLNPEAIQWCSEYLRPGKFSCVDPWPPTPYEDASFEVVVGVSVFTHLARDVQKTWLAEMRRIIVPGGLFLASTHGVFAAWFAFPKDFATILRHGIHDKIHSPSLDGIVARGYYRDVFQTREYTMREWSNYFEILEYVERGMGNHQDLVVMRRPA